MYCDCGELDSEAGVAKSTISGKIRCFLGDFHENAYIDESCTIIGNVSIGDASSVWPQTVIRGDVQEVSIGERTNIQDGSILHVTSDNTFTPGGYPLIIGDDVIIKSFS